jgi:competence protein ComEA
VPHRLALLVTVAATLLPAALRVRVETPARREACAPAGFGTPPRGWLGCAADGGPRRALTGAERLAVGLPLDLNTAGAGELAYVPGLSPRLGSAIVADRRENGLFAEVEAVLRVRGIGPKRLARARPMLAVEPGR